MIWLKIENNNLVYPTTFDKSTNRFNCNLNTRWLIDNKFTPWTEEQLQQWLEQHQPNNQIDKTNFENACSYFRQICYEIGTLMGVEDFKGGFDDMPIFYAHESYKTNKGMQLAIAWSGCNDLCNYEANKIGLGQPDWWYQCWKEQSSSSN